MENTNPTGSESLDVNQAASAFEGMMGDSEEAEQGQAEGQPEYQQGLGRLCARHPMPWRGQQHCYPVDPYASRATVRCILGPGPM